MSTKYDTLHSHSGLERMLNFPKHLVLIDVKYGPDFDVKESFSYNGKEYYKVPIIDFVKHGGMFKNLSV